MAQLAEQLICNQQVEGSSPPIGLTTYRCCVIITFVVSQGNDAKVIPSNTTRVQFGWIPEWPKGTDCKSAAYCFGGSNPPPSILKFNIAGWSSLEARRAHNPEVIGSNPVPATRYLLYKYHAQIAQLVEQRTENPRVAGSIPALGIFILE